MLKLRCFEHQVLPLNHLLPKAARSDKSPVGPCDLAQAGPTESEGAKKVARQESHGSGDASA